MANPTNKSYDGIITWATGSSNDIIAKQLATARTISITNNSGTALASGTFNGTGNLTLKLPATVVIDISGNAATATLATGSTNIRVTDTDSNIWYPLVFSSGSAANANYVARVDSDSILVNSGVSPAAGTQGNCYLQLGNAKTTAAPGNKRGVLRIYGTGTACTEITSATVATTRSISFPDKAGTVALTSDISINAKTTLADLLAVLHKTSTEISNVSSYTASSDCILRIRIGDVYWWQVFINSTVYQHQQRNNGDSAVTEYVYMVLKKGDVVTASSSSASTYRFNGTVYAI